MVFDYQVVPHGSGWSYRLEQTYSSRVFATQMEAVAAAKAAAVAMHEAGDRTQVRVQDAPLEWRVDLVIEDRPAHPAASRESAPRSPFDLNKVIPVR